MTDRRILADAVRQFIAERGVTHQRFAEYIGTHPTHLSRLLNGTDALTYEMGVRIANGLGVRLGAVMDPPDAPGPKEPIRPSMPANQPERDDAVTA